jgi:CTP synthase (UTP-ammonia lyase)
VSGTGWSPEAWIAVIGDRTEGFAPQDSIASAIDHAAASIAVAAPPVRWIATNDLADSGPDLLSDAIAVWCAPGGPYRSLPGALEGIRWARERAVPFLGTCAGFQHAVIEFARNVLGYESASHAEYVDPADEMVMFIDELLCALVGQTMSVKIVDQQLLDMYGVPTPLERYYCRFGLHPRWREALDRAGLRVAGVDTADGDVRILRLADHPFFVLTLFVPQTSSTPATPHPLITGYIEAALGLSNERTERTCP